VIRFDTGPLTAAQVYSLPGMAGRKTRRPEPRVPAKSRPSGATAAQVTESVPAAAACWIQ